MAYLLSLMVGAKLGSQLHAFPHYEADTFEREALNATGALQLLHDILKLPDSSGQALLNRRLDP